MQLIEQHTLSNGLWVLLEQIPGVRSLALTWLLPAGVVHEPQDQQGVAAVLAEMICRGAGDLDARAHSQALEGLGVQMDTQVMSRHLRLSALMIGERAQQALPLIFDMVRRPQLAESTFAPSLDLALQALQSLEDEPQDHLLVELRRRHHPPPLNRSTLGLRQHLERLTPGQVRAYQQQTFVPAGSILALAGDLVPDRMLGSIQQHLADWAGTSQEPAILGLRQPSHGHLDCDSAQLHLGLACDMPGEADPSSLLIRTAVQVLSGGASSRLFTELREKRGLCYAVGAHYAGDRCQGSLYGYVGTTLDKAGRTLAVLRHELERLSQGVEPEEFHRARVGMKSALVMQGESTAARALALAWDQYLHGRPRSLDELSAQVDAISLNQLQAFLREHRLGPWTLVSLGPQDPQVLDACSRFIRVDTNHADECIAAPADAADLAGPGPGPGAGECRWR